MSGTVALTSGTAIAYASFAAGQTVLEPRQVQRGLVDPTALRGVGAAGAYLLVVALIGLAAGAMLRHTAAALGCVFAVLFLIPQIVHALPGPWDVRLGKYLLPNAAHQIVALYPDSAYLSKPACWLVLTAWTGLAGLGAALAVTRRDP